MSARRYEWQQVRAAVCRVMAALLKSKKEEEEASKCPPKT